MQESVVAIGVVMLAIGLLVLATIKVQAQPPEQAAAATQPASGLAAGSPLDFTVEDIDGRPVELAKFKGDVLLIVNVASRCGLTPQYKVLEELHRKYRTQGLRILAFPSNDFMGQEPGTNAQIKEFCTSRYQVSFELFAKIAVKGPEQAPLYRYLTSTTAVGAAGGEIPWNFTKFLVGRDGRVLNRFSPRTRPDDPALIRALEQALAAPRE